MSTATATCTFERIGRRRNAPPVDVPVSGTDLTPDDADNIAAAVFDYAKKFLGSKWFEVTVYHNAQAGRYVGDIESGRFGKFAIDVREVQS